MCCIVYHNCVQSYAQRFIVVSGLLNNISKVYQSLITGSLLDQDDV